MTIVIPCAGKAARWGEDPEQWLVPYFPADRDDDGGFEPALETEARRKPAPQMAGPGQRRPPGPAPMFMAAGKPILEWALHGLGSWPTTARIVIVGLYSEKFERYLVETLPRRMEGRSFWVHFVNRSGSGEVETVLWARNLIVDADAPLLVAASNVYVSSDIVERARECGPECRAIVVAAKERVNPNHDWRSRLGENIEISPRGRVMAIGDEKAGGGVETAGTYYFARAGDFLEIASEIQRTDARVCGELRMHSVIGLFLRKQWQVEAVVAQEAWPLRCTADVSLFEHSPGAPGGKAGAALARDSRAGDS